MKSFLFFSLALAILGMAGCGDLTGQKVVKKQLESERFRADCELDVNAFTDVLKRNISSDIRCLEENLNIFLKVVKTDRPGYLSRDALEKFVVKNRPEIKPEMVRALKAVFDVNYLVTGESPEYISAENVDKLLGFARLFNEKAAQHWGTTFGSKKDVEWNVFKFQRASISNSVRVIVGSLRDIFKSNRNGEVHKLNILDLLDSFTTEDNREDIEKIKKVLFVKKIILGGVKDEITHQELDNLLLNLEPLLTIAHDAVRFQHIKDVTQNNIIELLDRDVNTLDDLVNLSVLGNRDNEILFTMDEAIEAGKMLIDKEDFDIAKFENLAREGKTLLMGGNRNDVKCIEMKNLLGRVKEILKAGSAFHTLYGHFIIALSSPFPVTINFNEYRHQYPDLQKEFGIFERIVQKYRFFKGEFESAYYFNGIKRNPDAIFEIYLLEYAIKIIFQTYGAPSPNADNPFGYSIEQMPMRELFKKFTKDLVDIGLLSPLWPMVTADNVSLLGTLFQYQSDKNNAMDVNEASEFGVSLLTTLKISDYLMEYYKKQNCAFDQFGRVEPKCMRGHFFQGICKNYRSYYPQLFASLNTPARCEDLPMSDFNKAFLERTILAARPCMNYTDGKKEEIWYTESDINTMLMVILHAETTIMRWDKNNNNTLDPDEVAKAYDIYAPALDKFLDTRPAVIKKFKRQIYLYLIKFEEVPDEKEYKSVWKFIRFLMSFSKASSASRKTIASILYSISEENKKLPTAPPPINCNLLRDPDNLPLNPEPLPRVKDLREDHSAILNGYLDFVD